jgi:hypothetical protein
MSDLFPDGGEYLLYLDSWRLVWIYLEKDEICLDLWNSFGFGGFFLPREAAVWRPHRSSRLESRVGAGAGASIQNYHYYLLLILCIHCIFDTIIMIFKEWWSYICKSFDNYYTHWIKSLSVYLRAFFYFFPSESESESNSSSSFHLFINSSFSILISKINTKVNRYIITLFR